MTERRQVLLAVALVCGLNFVCTLRDENAWPFCSYNMFNRVPPAEVVLWEAELTDSAGRTQVVDVRQVLPLEFFRVTDLVSRVYGGEGGAGPKAALAGIILGRLNGRPWGAFDETYAPACPSSGARFVRLRILRSTYAVGPGPDGPGLTLRGRQCLYEREVKG